MGVKKLLVQGGTFQNIGTRPLHRLLPVPNSQHPLPRGTIHPAGKEAASPPPNQGPVQETPEQLWGHSPPSWGAGPHHWGLRPDYGHATCPGAPRRPCPTGPVTLQCQDTRAWGGHLQCPGVAPCQPQGHSCWGLGQRPAPGKKHSCVRGCVLSPSAILSVCQVVSVLPHCQAASTSWMALRMSHRTAPCGFPCNCGDLWVWP